MKKFLIANALYGLSKQVPADELAQLKKDLSGATEAPQLQIIHNAYMREKMGKIEKHVKTIRLIAVVMFVFTILGAIIYALA